jgi:ferredoxin--NADP+ reductase
MMTDSPHRVAIIGAGPSGFYAAETLLKDAGAVSIDIIDRLPTPYGLIRHGVAPDHERIKSITRMLARTGSDPRVRFLGNVTYGVHLTHADLKAHYHSIIYATGASRDRQLQVPGEELPGSYSATEFVAWYNGHPDYAGLDPDLSASTAVIIGLGNVAIDLARILAKSVDELRSTDIADHALERLAESRIRDIHLIGRRGPAQARFTTKELRELGALANADIHVAAGDLELDPSSSIEAQSDPLVQRNLAALQGFAAQPPAGRNRRLHLRFLLSPVELSGRDRLSEVRFERNELTGPPGLGVTARGTGDYEVIPAGLLLRSVGYRGSPLPGVPFDEQRAVIPNQAGRVLDDSGAVVAGEYAVGWIKRGPSGVIGSNKADAMETVASLLADPRTRIAPEAADPAAVTRLLHDRGVRTVDFSDWEVLDRLEVISGQAQGRPRVKFVRIEEMLRQLERSGT